MLPLIISNKGAYLKGEARAHTTHKYGYRGNIGNLYLIKIKCSKHNHLVLIKKNFATMQLEKVSSMSYFTKPVSKSE